MTFPQSLHAGLYHDLGDTMSMMMSLGWEDWSVFSDLGVRSKATRPRR
jgi:long-subunit fatty acid transport protein